MSADSLLVQKIVDSLDALTKRAKYLPVRELERLEEKMTKSLRNNVVDVITKKQVHFTIEGYAINPLLPDNFSSCPNDQRPDSHHFWWCRPYILIKTSGEKTLFWVECLDGGAWDRPTWWGEAETLDAATEICRNGPTWKKTQ
ncbi:MAG: hypothetical protein WD071_02525 [Pseudohongiella sp.]|uniref:hypothetical protein n=1 Tax=Pseudohongiella sp. TaxID=1979412 RepID=UPI0034A01453